MSDGFGVVLASVFVGFIGIVALLFAGDWLIEFNRVHWLAITVFLMALLIAVWFMSFLYYYVVEE